MKDITKERKQRFMKGRFVSYGTLSPALFILATVGTALCIYLLCSFIDLARHYWFKAGH